MAEPKAQPRETVEAKEAFAAYVGLGVNRSLRKLAAELVRQERYKTETTAFNVAGRWSAQHKWQERIEQAVTDRAERMLREASEIDADTFLRTSRHLQRHVDHYGDIPDTVIKIRESVRKPMPKGGAQVDVVHSGTIKHAHKDMTAFTDDEIDALATIAERRKREIPA